MLMLLPVLKKITLNIEVREKEREEAEAWMATAQPILDQKIDSQIDGAAHASSGQLITWVFIPLLGTSGVSAYERTVGTLRRLLTTPTKKATFLLGTITGQLGQAVVQMALLLLFAVRRLIRSFA